MFEKIRLFLTPSKKTHRPRGLIVVVLLSASSTTISLAMQLSVWSASGGPVCKDRGAFIRPHSFVTIFSSSRNLGDYVG